MLTQEDIIAMMPDPDEVAQKEFEKAVSVVEIGVRCAAINGRFVHYHEFEGLPDHCVDGVTERFKKHFPNCQVLIQWMATNWELSVDWEIVE